MDFSLAALRNYYKSHLGQDDPPQAGGPGAPGCSGPSAAPTASKPVAFPPAPRVGNADSIPIETQEDSAGAALARRNASAGQPTAGAFSAGGATAVQAATEGKPAFRGITADQLRAAMPRVCADKVDEYLPLLNDTMQENEINTPVRQAAFLAQLAHESGQLRGMNERGSGARYEGRRDLGNTQVGDGERFKGRGPIQLTGRANYEAAGRALGVDLATNPDQVAHDPAIGFRTAGWFWRSRRLNAQADLGNFAEITRRVVGKANHPSLPDREVHHARARQALGIP